MQLRFPLLAKILGWLFLNLVILAGAFFLVFKVQYKFSLDSVLAGRAGERLQAVGNAVAGELKNKPIAAWPEVLKNFSQAYQADFLLYRADGTPIAGAAESLPEPVAAKLTGNRGPGYGLGRGPPPGRGPRHGWGGGLAAVATRFLVKTERPTQYWAGLRLDAVEPERTPPWPVVLVLRSTSLSAGGLFVDFRPLAIAGFGALLFSALFWVPLVRSLTRALARMTRITERIALGDFDVKVAQRRTDELGRLGQAINAMAARLSGFVSGQKRFLGDVAHELCSPVARLQAALGVLEQRANEDQRGYVEDVREEVQRMAELIEELLSFSKAGLAEKEIKLQPVNLRTLAGRIADRERTDRCDVQLRMEGDLCALAEPNLLFRALANLARNSVRYAGEAGPICIAGSRLASRVNIVIQDDGPGVPESSLQQIFDPFFRGEASRSRDTGGVGLGLAIVKTCVEACGGTVSARNRRPHGLEVTITLQAAFGEGLPTAGREGPVTEHKGDPLHPV